MLHWDKGQQEVAKDHESEFALRNELRTQCRPEIGTSDSNSRWPGLSEWPWVVETVGRSHETSRQGQACLLKRKGSCRAWNLGSQWCRTGKDWVCKRQAFVPLAKQHKGKQGTAGQWLTESPPACIETPSQRSVLPKVINLYCHFIRYLNWNLC